jgi:tRNA1(Val) A37 N6-methylase TrmN6
MSIHLKLMPSDLGYPIIETQNLHTTPKNKSVYGEVHTPFYFIREMLTKLPKSLFSDKTKKWLDPCAGRGYFAQILYEILYSSLKDKGEFPTDEYCKQYILEEMVYQIELNVEHRPFIERTFGQKNKSFKTSYNFIWDNFLAFDQSYAVQKNWPIQFDVIVGNPPYNALGFKKVPTNTKDAKEQDGLTAWPDFVYHSLKLLRLGGYLCMIIPSIWLKPDKTGLHYYLTSPLFEITYLHSYSNTETNRIFSGEAQTPTSIVVVRKKLPIACEPEKSVHQLSQLIQIYDSFLGDTYSYEHHTGEPIPTHTPSIVQKLIRHARKYKPIHVVKTSTVPKRCRPQTCKTKTNSMSKSTSKSNPQSYIGIKSCIFRTTRDKSSLKHFTFKIDQSQVPFPYQSERKIILAHKMYGIPFYDISGSFGISSRDNYLILEEHVIPIHIPGLTCVQKMRILQTFLSSSLVLFLFDTTRYRMRYLEKYAFEFIPNILQMIQSHVAPKDIAFYDNDINLCTLFGLQPSETEYIVGNYPRYSGTITFPSSSL